LRSRRASERRQQRRARKCSAPLDAGTSKTHDILPAVPIHIRQLALVEVVADPTAGARREGREFKRGRRESFELRATGLLQPSPVQVTRNSKQALIPATLP
jgi:hypothetical protein